ncbi:organic hydroperoxide resistance protein [Nocardioides zeae]|uniref:Organic hydroperoxide resistance protein n=1 Tax=Nocardioides imazamoxiresistens TaxID=3231893 RepID=A0ABU3PZP6_9ACTN|nr:organic hydroperoxide resistance protein [Nocardioides zeae]MDT9594267.1 organic hydroperoxide resistance protein [Nocardioides zeae]
MPTEIKYTASATATGEGRQGHARTSDGSLEVDLIPPKELGGAGGGVDPEKLFAAGYAACFLGALKAGAKQHGIELQDVAVTAEVGIGPREDVGFGLAVKLIVEFGGGVSQADAERAVEVGHTICPYTHATKGNIDVTTEVDVA